MTTRVEVNLQTRQRVEIPLTQAELDDAAARTAAEAPIIAARIAEEQQVAAVRGDAVINYLATHTPAECAARILQLTLEERWEAVAKALCILVRRM